MKDADLMFVEGLRRRDPEAFESLYRQHVRRIHNYAMSKLRNTAEAEDVAQEVFEAVFQCIDKYEGRADLLVWVFGITRNVIHNRVRRRANARLGSLEHVEEPAAPAHQSPDRQVQARISLGRAREIIDALSEDQQRILELRHDERLPIREIASIMRRSEDAIKSSLYRTRKALAERLPDELV